MKEKLSFIISIMLCILLASSSVVLAAEVDFDSHWARSSIMRLYDRGIITGESNTDGMIIVNADRQITRAEFVTMLIRLLTVTESIPTTSSIYPDTKGHWAESYINLANKAGFITGYPDGTFKPNDPINRAEITTIMIKVLNYADQEIKEKSFIDVDSAFWARAYIMKAKQNAIVTGYPDNSFRPLAYASRGEAITIIDRVNNSFISQLTVQKGIVQSVIREINVVETEIIEETEATNSCKLSDMESGKYTLDKSLLEYSGPYGFILELENLQKYMPEATINSKVSLKIGTKLYALPRSDLGDPIFIGVLPNDLSEEGILGGEIVVK